MLRLCSKKLVDVAQLRALSSLALPTINKLEISPSTLPARQFSSVSPASPAAAAAAANAVSTDEYPYSDPDKVKNADWKEIEDWSFEWFDGRDKLHIEITPTSKSTDWRGIGFYSKEAYWMGSLRWNERLRNEQPAVWLHWNGKDPVELSNTLPATDNGVYKFCISFTKREFVIHCNGELLGTRKNMLYQYRNVGRIWFADLEEVKASYMIEGDRTDDSGYTIYHDVPMFQDVKQMWKKFREVQTEHSNEQHPDNGWRS